MSSRSQTPLSKTKTLTHSKTRKKQEKRSTPRFPGKGKRSNGVTASRHACIHVRAAVGGGRCVRKVPIQCVHKRSVCLPRHTTIHHCSAGAVQVSAVSIWQGAQETDARYSYLQQGFASTYLTHAHPVVSPDTCFLTDAVHRAYHILPQPLSLLLAAARCTAAHRPLSLSLAISQPRLILPYSPVSLTLPCLATLACLSVCLTHSLACYQSRLQPRLPESEVGSTQLLERLNRIGGRFHVQVYLRGGIVPFCGAAVPFL
jgi:hypothetical protein